VYHNYSIAIDASRQLFNGTPALIARLIDVLALQPGSRVLHIGAGLGYYSALIAQIVTASGRLVAIEVDGELAAEARRNLAAYPWVDVRHGDGSETFGTAYDAILVNAGVTHPQQAWLDAMAPGGRLLFPITATMPQMGPIGKGVIVLITKGADTGSFEARAVTFVAIYSAIGLRDAAGDGLVAAALQRAPFPRLKRLRLDPHAAGAGCWLHAATFCLTTA
jgi:protein-L-isoaspartate(D-aspartate) O-methyltransferase